MTKTPDEHAGSGLDKPDPKTILEKVGDGIKAVLPKKEPEAPKPTGNGTVQRIPE